MIIETRRPTWKFLVRLIALIALTGLLGSVKQARASVALERSAFEARVDAVRKALPTPGRDGMPTNPTAQWYNWGNWNNWNNWANWGNWGNWFNR